MLNVKFLFLAVALVLSSCTSTGILKAHVTDAVGKPITGAVVYLEAWTHPSANDFCYGITDSTGQVAVNAQTSITLKSGSRIAWAAFAEGKEPMAVIDYRPAKMGGIMEIQLVDWVAPGTGSSSRVSKLAFPFPDHSDLRNRVSRPENSPLRVVFWKAYGLPTVTFRPEDQYKFAALKGMIEAIPLP